MSRIFEHFNDTTNCPICGGRQDGRAVLIPIEGTSNGGCCRAEQVHLDCLLSHPRYIKYDSMQDWIVCHVPHATAPSGGEG